MHKGFKSQDANFNFKNFENRSLLSLVTPIHNMLNFILLIRMVQNVIIKDTFGVLYLVGDKGLPFIGGT
jgi:hypothetical protein